MHSLKNVMEKEKERVTDLQGNEDVVVGGWLDFK